MKNRAVFNAPLAQLAEQLTLNHICVEVKKLMLRKELPIVTMLRVSILGRNESVTALISDNSDRMPPRLKICSIDIVYDAGYGEVIDASLAMAAQVLRPPDILSQIPADLP